MVEREKRKKIERNIGRKREGCIAEKLIYGLEGGLRKCAEIFSPGKGYATAKQLNPIPQSTFVFV